MDLKSNTIWVGKSYFNRKATNMLNVNDRFIPHTDHRSINTILFQFVLNFNFMPVFWLKHYASFFPTILLRHLDSCRASRLFLSHGTQHRWVYSSVLSHQPRWTIKMFIFTDSPCGLILPFKFQEFEWKDQTFLWNCFNCWISGQLT